ncbi:hypothetical protein D3C84_1049280 [compost metagenome]
MALKARVTWLKVGAPSAGMCSRPKWRNQSRQSMQFHAEASSSISGSAATSAGVLTGAVCRRALASG